MNDTVSLESSDAWGDFWAQNLGADGGGCLPQRWAAIEEAQRKAWRDFIADLPRRSTILDLATGDGRVLRWMREVRPDLVLTGIDLAPQLPPAPDGTETRGGVAMEDLPFEDGSIDAIVSQFGFEYGDVPSVAAEISRVLSPGGRVGLMVHRGDGPILEHNRKRQTAIEWVAQEKSVPRVAKSALGDPRGGPEAAAQVASALGMLGANKFGQDSPAWEIPEAIRRAVAIAKGNGNAAVVDLIEAIEKQATNELGRIASLAEACATADNRDAVIAAFSVHELNLKTTTEVIEPAGRALADFLTFA